MIGRDPAYEVQCPFCQAGPQEPCVSFLSHTPVVWPHAMRRHEAGRRGLYAAG